MESPFKPKLTVVTVVKDAKDDFYRTAQSLNKLIGDEIEWVVVDGDSNDGTDELIKYIGSEINIRYFRLPPKGIYNAMNFAIAQSTGEWIWFLNAGDIVFDGQLAKEFFDSLPSVPRHIQLLALPVAYLTREEKIYSYVLPNISKKEGEVSLIANHQGAFIRKAALFDAGLFDENLKYAADGKLLDYLAENFEVDTRYEMFIGFMMGGVSSKNFTKLHREIAQYRSLDLRSISYRKTVVKNFLRDLLLLGENMFAIGLLVRIYLNYRQRKVLKASARQGIKLSKVYSFGAKGLGS